MHHCKLSREAQIEAYFSEDAAFEGMLRNRGKEAEADLVHAASELPVSFVYQDEPLGLGHAVHCAAEKMDGDPFFVLLGDYFVPDCQMNVRMAEVSRAHNGASVIAVAPVPPDQVSRYGIIAGECIGSLNEDSTGEESEGAVWRVSGLVEKPAPEEAPSHLFIVGRYLLSPRVMELLADQKPGLVTKFSSPMQCSAFWQKKRCMPWLLIRLRGAIRARLPRGQQQMLAWH